LSNNLLLTGIPRSGTTLACHLLNRLPDTLALHEPMEVERFPQLAAAGSILTHIQGFCDQCRRDALERGRVPSKEAGGAVPDNHFTDERDARGQRRWVAEFRHGEIAVDKPLGADFLLVIKHPVAFTALLGALGGAFPVFAIIRNPLAVLLSWQGVPLPVAEGRAPAGEALDAGLKARLDGAGGPLARQLALLDWFYAQYRLHLPAAHILRYEAIIASGGGALSPVAGAAGTFPWGRLGDRNRHHLGPSALAGELAARLLSEEGAWRTFYTEEEVAALVERG
jgi:hypothetical protein